MTGEPRLRARLGGALVAPRWALAAADQPDAAGRAGSDAALLLLVAMLALHVRALVAAVWLGWLFGVAEAATALVGAIGQAMGGDLAFVLIAGAAVFLAAGRRRSLGRDFDLACVAYVPLATARVALAVVFWVAHIEPTRAVTDAAGAVGYGWAALVLGLAVMQARGRREGGEVGGAGVRDDARAAAAAAPARTMWAGHALALLLGVLAGLQIAWVARNRDALRPLAPGDAAPAFVLPRLDHGGEVALSSLRGQVVVVDFWATWCGPCRKSMPALENVHRAYQGRGVTVVSVDTEGWAAEAAALRIAAELGVTFTMVVDDGTVANQYHVQTIPHMVVVDRHGIVRAVHHGGEGAQLERRLGAELDELLAEK